MYIYRPLVFFVDYIFTNVIRIKLSFIVTKILSCNFIRQKEKNDWLISSIPQPMLCKGKQHGDKQWEQRENSAFYGESKELTKENYSANQKTGKNFQKRSSTLPWRTFYNKFFIRDTITFCSYAQNIYNQDGFLKW